MTLLLFLLAGCLQSASDPTEELEPNQDGSASTAPLLPSSEDLQPIADADAQVWNSAARLILIAMFEGDFPQASSLVPGVGGDPWVGPQRGLGGDLGDGRSGAWSFSYAVDNEESQLAMAICEAGLHAEVRTAHVVTVAADGSILAAYDTRNDDEGSTTTGFLPEGLIGPAEAAQRAEAELRLPHQAATHARTFLMSEWSYEQPAWVFILDNDSKRDVVGVDAQTGEVLGPPASPRC